MTYATPAPTIVATLPVCLRGAPASPGHIRGLGRILRSAEDGAFVRPGDIVVCVDSSTAWIPLLSTAAGIVTETGGALSSLATAARESGLPMVAGVQNATARIRDGQAIEIDGATGVVSLRD